MQPPSLDESCESLIAALCGASRLQGGEKEQLKYASPPHLA